MQGREEVRNSDWQEAEAIRQAQRGDANAFELLYRLHSSRVFALCLRMLKNNAEAEDMTQETFLTVFRAIRTFRGDSAFSSWLHRVTMNCVLMHIRRKALAQVSLEEEGTAMRIPPGAIKHLTVLDKLEAMDDLDFERLSANEISQLWRQLLAECAAWIAATEGQLYGYVN